MAGFNTISLKLKEMYQVCELVPAAGNFENIFYYIFYFRI